MKLDLIAVVRNQIGGLFDVANALEAILAGLVSHERRQLRAVRANGVGHFLHQGKPFLPWTRRPYRIGGPRGRDRLAGMLPGALLKRSEPDAGVDRAAILELLRRLDRPAVNIKRVFAPEGLRCAGDGVIERTMQILEMLTTECRVSDLGQFPSSLVP
jgi:hypothetical protein